MNNKHNNLSKENIKNRLFNIVPIVTYIFAFFFTVFFEIVNAKLDFKIVLTAQFWMVLVIKYAIVIVVMAIMMPYFNNKIKQGKLYTETKTNARTINKAITERRLAGVFVDYTKEQMQKEEEECFKQMLSDCGKIDPVYLEPTSTIEFIKKQYKEKKLHKEQYRLLINIKKGRLKFHKLNGTEIKYIGDYSVDERNRYANRKKAVLLWEVCIKLGSFLILQFLFTLLINSLFADGQIHLKGDVMTIILTVTTTILNYLTSILFAKHCAEKQVQEVIRFTEEVTGFAERFVEAIDTHQYIPKVEDDVKAQLEKFNEEAEEEETIELTDDEMKLLLENREKAEQESTNQ